MSYAESLLADGELIIYRTKQHWLAPIARARYAVGLIVLGLIAFLVAWKIRPASNDTGAVAGLMSLLANVLSLGTLVCLVAGIAWLVKVYMQWSAEDYVVTDRRVIKIEGLINKHAADSSLDKINDAVIEQHMLGRLLGYGNLEILTAAEEAVDRYFMLNHALVFKRQMLDAKHDMETGGRRGPTPPLRAEAVNGSRRMTPDEVTQTLARLADLRDRGAISPEEYEAKKASLLAQI